MTDDGDVHDHGELAPEARDVALGEAITALPVPPREDGFVIELMARLDAAESGLASAGERRGLRAWARGGRLRLAAAVAIAAAAAAALILFGPGVSSQRGGAPVIPGPEPATAAQIIRSSLDATAAAQTYRGIMLEGRVRGWVFHPNLRASFIVSENGDLAFDMTVVPGSHPSFFMGGPFGGAPSSVRAVYDTDTRKVTYLVHYNALQHAAISVNGRVRHRTYVDAALVLRSLAAGPAGGLGSSIFEDIYPIARLRAYMLQMLGLGTSQVTEVTVNGRPAWKLETTQVPGSFNFGEPMPVTLVIDKATRFPVVFMWSWGNGQTYEIRVRHPRLGDVTPAGAFEVHIPAHAWVRVTSPLAYFEGTSHDLPLENAGFLAKIVTDEPAFPGWVPSGFTRTQATYAGNGEAPSGESLIWPSPVSVSLAYRRGFDAFYVSAQQTMHGSGSATENGKKYRLHLGDPFMQTYGPEYRYLVRHTVNVRLTSGPFEGRTAHIVIDPGVLVHLWVRDPAYTVTIAGDLTIDDMVHVAESLQTGEQLAQAMTTSPSP